MARRCTAQKTKAANAQGLRRAVGAPLRLRYTGGMTSPEQLFASVVSHGIPGETAAELLDYFQGHGSFDAGKGVDDRGRNVFQVWFEDARSSYGPPAETVAAWAQRFPAVWGNRDRNGSTLSDRVLHRLLGDSGRWSEFEALEAVRWLRVIPIEALRSWRSRRGTTVLESCLDAGQEAAAAVTALAEMGFRLTGVRSGGVPVAAGIQTGEQWRLYLNQGGDPEVPVRDADDAVLPLWEHLCRRGKYYPKSDLRETVQAWANTHRQAGLHDLSNQEYWEKLSRSRTASDVTAAVVAAKDWFERRDADGRSALMVVAGLNASALNTLCGRARAWSANAAAPDRWGRNLWAYLLAHGRVAPDVCREVAPHVPFEVGLRGEGWLQQCLVPESGKILLHERGFTQSSLAQDRSLPERSSLWADAVRARPALLWGEPETQDELALWLVRSAYWGSSAMNNRKFFDASALCMALCRWAELAPPDPITPLLRGALTLVGLLSRSRLDSGDALVARMKQGEVALPPQTEWSESLLLGVSLNPGLKPQIEAIHTASRLNRDLEEPRTASRKHRM